MAEDLRFVLLAVWIILAILHSFTGAEKNDPRVISPKEFPHLLLGGARLQYVVGDLSNCTANFMNNDSFTFARNLKHMLLNYDDVNSDKWSTIFSHTEMVDGRWEGLPGPAARYMYAVMVEDATAFMFSDLDPENHAPLNPIALIKCQGSGIGGSVIAKSDVRTPLPGLAELTTALSSGYQVTYTFDENKCQQVFKQSNGTEETHSVYFGLMENFQFNDKGELATTSFMVNFQNYALSWLEMTISTDDQASVDVIFLSTLDGETNVDSYACAVGPDKGVSMYKLQQ